MLESRFALNRKLIQFDLLQVCAIKAPGVFCENRKSSLQDLAVLTGGSLVTEELGLNLGKVELDMLGTCKKAFHLMLYMICPETHKAETKVIESCRMR
ncbi:hypothetical protein GBA52_012820 [Prunus armeniaca]|nr:hypothetical protein GBA52_012820 [Prunus armeniaca]